MLDSAASVCPFCSRRETPTNQNLVCGPCVHAGVEIIRNSVIENERLNNQMRNDINAVFSACDQIQHSDAPFEAKDFEKLRQHEDFSVATPDVIYNKVKLTRVATPGLLAVKNLALQLEKLEIMNSSLRINGIERSKESLEKRVARLQAKIDSVEAEIASGRTSVQQKKAGLTEQYQLKSHDLDSQHQLLIGESTGQVAKQSLLLMRAHYNAVREVALLRPLSVLKDECPLLYHQPVLPLPTFLEYSNKPDVVSRFLENLISLQLLLFDLLRIDNELLELPYLSELAGLLPDSAFYDLIQNQINRLVFDDENVPIEEEEPEPELYVADTSTENIDKIVIKDNVIVVPISFRTRNLQRRASVKSPEADSRHSTPTSPTDLRRSSARPEDTSRTSLISRNGHTEKEPATQSKIATKQSWKGKTLVFVPHKILRRPFNKLNAKDYTMFVEVVGKILINFHVLLSCTAHPVPGPKLRHQSSMGTLTSTFNNLRLNLASGADEGEQEPEFLYDFRKILAKLANLDSYFKHRESELFKKAETPHTSHSGSVLGLSAISNTTSEFDSAYSEHSASTVNINASLVSARIPESPFSNLYHMFRRKSGPAPKRTEPTTEANIYGMVSETQSVKESSYEEKTQAAKTDKSSDTPDIKVVMNTVYDIIARGSSGTRAGAASAKDEAAWSATLSMMAQLKAQLDEWDVVSRMYKNK